MTDLRCTPQECQDATAPKSGQILTAAYQGERIFQTARLQLLGRALTTGSRQPGDSC